MIFLTVGSVLPFDRLVRLVDDAVADQVIEDEVFAQIGNGSYTPRSFEFTRFLTKTQYDDYICRATAIVSHAGIGTISCALELNKPILVMPRRKKMHEVVDDHQLKTARIFVDLGHVLAFSDENELREQLDILCDFRPLRRQPNIDGIATAIADYLTDLVSTVRHGRGLV